MTNVRRATKGLNTEQVKELNYGWHHAARVGRPLNAFLTIWPMHIDDMPPAESSRLFSAVRNSLTVIDEVRRAASPR